MLYIRCFVLFCFCCVLSGCSPPSVENPPVDNSKGDSSNATDSTETLVLFDGSNLDHFRGYKTEKLTGWEIDGEMLTLKNSQGVNLTTKEQFRNFTLLFDWKVKENSNSGVMYRVSLGDNAPYYTGPEYQVLDDIGQAKKEDSKYSEIVSAGALYGLCAPESKTLQPVGQWNSAKIVVNGNHVEHWLNGQKIVDVEMNNDQWNEKIKQTKFNEWKKFGKNESGHIVFQDHGDQVWYRNIRLQQLPD